MAGSCLLNPILGLRFDDSSYIVSIYGTYEHIYLRNVIVPLNMLGKSPNYTLELSPTSDFNLQLQNWIV